MSIYFETEHEGVKKSRKATGTIARWYTWAWFEREGTRRVNSRYVDHKYTFDLETIPEGEREWCFGGMSVTRQGAEAGAMKYDSPRDTRQVAYAPVTIRRTGADLEEKGSEA